MDAIPRIALRGVRVHNLKKIDVDIPFHRMTVVTGVNGAGKSSLVFDTLYAEAQRRYLQSFSTYTRQFLERFDRPDAVEISDLPPAIAIRSGTHSRTAHGTVGALAEISHELRLLFARCGTLVCSHCGQPVIQQRPHDVLRALLALPAGTRCTIACAATLDPQTDQASWLASLLEEGYYRIQIGKITYKLGEQQVPLLSAVDKIWVLLDRVEIGKTATERLLESIVLAFRRGEGRFGVLTQQEAILFDQHYYCARCDLAYPAPEPRRFDPDDPLGRCLVCQGTDTVDKMGQPCPSCQGTRFQPDALRVRLDGWTIVDWSEQPLEAVLPFALGLKLQDASRQAGEVLLQQIQQRLRSLVAMNLGYLSLQQRTSTLSEGVLKRIALAAAMVSNLVQVLYLVEEPFSGLHPRDIPLLLDVLLQLRDRGNTLVVIEHERSILAAADHVVDLGPGAGDEGGEVTYQGPPQGLDAAAENPTSDYWSERSFIEIPRRRRKPSGVLQLRGTSIPPLDEGTIDFPLGVLCVVTGVGGSGKRRLVAEMLYPALRRMKKKKAAAGDSSSTSRDQEARGKLHLIGSQQLAEVVLLDQESLPRSSRSNPTTYLKIFDEIRAMFAQTIEARIRNFGAGVFSFNLPGGRCETCEGEGTLTIDMRFLADVVSPCPACHGRRYRKEILDIKVRSLSIAEVLDLTIREAFRFFRAQPRIEKKLRWLIDVGLDYLRLGQALDTFSGAECQRLKLAGHLASSRKPGTLFLLLEPAAGLHPADVANLLTCFDRLLAAGHSLIAVENQLEMVACADHVIDLGPHGVKGGGRIVAQGTPEEIIQTPESHTGRFLKMLFKRRQGSGA